MAAGGVFKILTNDGKADQMLMATQLLKDRICDIIDAREAAGLDDTLPTLKDIEKTHVLHFQSKFKPFVALGYEYQRVRPQAGTTALNGSVTYSIPQFGDFLSDMVLNLTLTACFFSTGVLPALSTAFPDIGPAFTAVAIPTTIGTGYQTFALPDGSTLNTYEASNTTFDGVPRSIVRRVHFLRYVNGAGATYTDGTSSGAGVTPSQIADRIYYCDWPGERSMKRIAFEVNGNPLDDYDLFSYAFYRKFRLNFDKRYGYYRDMGQEYPTAAISNNISDGAVNPATSGVNSTLTVPGTRKSEQILNGPQTPQLVQPSLNLWIKLLFWFNLDQSQALVSAAIPYGQRFINVDFASSDDMVFRAPAAYAVAVMITDIYGTANPAAIGVATQPPAALTIISTNSQVLLYPQYTNGTLTAPNIQIADLYVNNIFTIPEVHDIYIERIGFSLIRVHRRQTQGINTSTLDLQLSQFKYPIEFFYVGLLPDVNFKQGQTYIGPPIVGPGVPSTVASPGTLTAGPNLAIPGARRDQDWHVFTYNTRRLALNSSTKIEAFAFGTAGAFANQTGVANSATGATLEFSATASPTIATTFFQVIAKADSTTWVQNQRTIDTVQITAHGVALYQTVDAQFFNAYIPDAYERNYLVTPDDLGALFINFSLHPYLMQPSGHINTSRAREFFITFTSSLVGAAVTGIGYASTTNTPPVAAPVNTLTATLYTEASALNFLLITDGSAVLRYTT